MRLRGLVLARPHLDFLVYRSPDLRGRNVEGFFLEHANHAGACHPAVKRDLLSSQVESSSSNVDAHPRAPPVRALSSLRSAATLSNASPFWSRSIACWLLLCFSQRIWRSWVPGSFWVSSGLLRRRSLCRAACRHAASLKLDSSACRTAWPWKQNGGSADVAAVDERATAARWPSPSFTLQRRGRVNHSRWSRSLELTLSCCAGFSLSAALSSGAVSARQPDVQPHWPAAMAAQSVPFFAFPFGAIALWRTCL